MVGSELPRIRPSTRRCGVYVEWAWGGVWTYDLVFDQSGFGFDHQLVVAVDRHAPRPHVQNLIHASAFAVCGFGHGVLI